MAIQIIQNGRRPLFWIMEENVSGHPARCGTPLSTYTPNLVKISSSAAEICPQNGIRTPLAAEFYFQVQL